MIFLIAPNTPDPPPRFRILRNGGIGIGHICVSQFKLRPRVVILRGSRFRELRALFIVFMCGDSKARSVL